MSVAAISTSSFLPSNTNPTHNNARFGEEIRQLGQDLQSGNLSAAQQDFTTLQQDGSPGSASPGSASPANSNNPVTQAFHQLSVDLQSGNPGGAQQSYSNIEQDFSSTPNLQSDSLHRFVNGSGGTIQANPLFLDLGQELENGTLSSAQQGYGALTPDASFGQAAATQTSNAVSLNI